MVRVTRVLLFALLSAIAVPVTAQTLSTTTLSAAVLSATTTTISVAASTVQTGQWIWVDREAMLVRSGGSTTLTVTRAIGGFASTHGSGAQVYYGPPSFFWRQDPTSSSCQGTGPNVWINVDTGGMWSCYGGLWRALTTVTPAPVGTVLQGNGPTVPPSFATLTTDPVAWGDIIGTLSNQTDLQAALDAKMSLASANTVTTNGAASTPVIKFTGSIFTGGSGTTTTPFMLWQPTGTTAATDWSTSGTWWGVNAPTGFAGNFIDLRINAGGRFSLDKNGVMTFSNGSTTNAISPFLAEGIMEMVGGWQKRESTANVVTYFNGWFKQTSDRLYGLYAPNANNTGLAIANMDAISSTQTLSLVPFQHIERSVAITNCNGAKTVDVGLTYFGAATGNWYNYTVTGSSCELTFSNLQAGGHYFIILIVDGTGGYTQPTITNTVRWDAGSAPALDMTANKLNLIEFWYDGTNLIGKAQVIGG